MIWLSSMRSQSSWWSWRGVFRFGFKTTGHDGRPVAHRSLDGGKTVGLDVA